MKISKLKRVLSTMPPLRHAFPDQDYDVTKSEVVKWLVQQPEALEMMFQKARETKFIAFDRDAKTWAGCPFPADETESASEVVEV